MIRIIITFVGLLGSLIPAVGQNVGIGEPSPAAKLEIRGANNVLLNSLLVKDGTNNPLLSVNNQGRVGINVVDPEVPLHVYAPGVDEVMRIRGGFPYISFHNQPQGYSGYLWSNGLRFELGTPVSSGIPIAITPELYPAAVFMPNGYVGLGGVTDPVFPVDVNGRMRLRHVGGTPGIFFNNSTNSDSPAFVGMVTNTSVGFYGGGIGWGFQMNTNTGDVNISGNAIADNFVFTIPAVRYLSVPYSAFSAGNSAEQMHKSNGGAWLVNGVSSLHAPVSLPHGATIINIGFNVLDVGGSSDLECTLYRQPVTAGPFTSIVPEVMALARTGGNPGNTVISDNTIDNPVINNQNYSYYIVVRNVIFSGTTVQPWESSFMLIYAANITYTITNTP